MHRIRKSLRSVWSTCMYVVRMGYPTITMFSRKGKDAKGEWVFLFDKPFYKSVYACCWDGGLILVIINIDIDCQRNAISIKDVLMEAHPFKNQFSIKLYKKAQNNKA